MNTNIFMDCKF